jgi:hypothetical protein
MRNLWCSIMVMVNDKLLSFGEIDEFGTLLVVVVET